MSATVFTGTTDRGAAVTVTVEVTEPDVPVLPEQTWPPPMTVGATLNAVDFGQFLPGGRQQSAEFCRTFSSPGDGILDWTHPRRVLPPGVADFHSFKDWKSDDDVVANVTRLLDTMPAGLVEGEALLPHLSAYDPDGYAPDSTIYDGFSLLLSYCHEGEKNFIDARLAVREWRRRHALVYKTIRQHCNGRRVGYMPIQTGTWTEASSVVGKIKGDFDPLAWWAGVGDYAGYDAYAETITNRPAGPALYKAAADFLTIPLRLARGTGRRLFLPELGVVLQGSAKTRDDGTFRAAWIRAVVAELRDQGCAGVAWWDALGANNRDFRLLDEPSRAAWQDAIYGR